MRKEKKEIGIETLIELLNEYEKEKHPSRIDRNYYLGFVHNFGVGIMYIDAEGEDVDDYRTDYEIISKEYGFIKWLVENEKIDLEKLPKHLQWEGVNTDIKGEDLVIMVLSIQDEPIRFLCEILK